MCPKCRYLKEERDGFEKSDKEERRGKETGLLGTQGVREKGKGRMETGEERREK